nr:type-1 angiotensin II receptor-associated protein isoform X1 [Cavia porcellus]
MELPAVNLKVILLVHWLLTTWGSIVFGGPYSWANFTILALGVWAVAQRDSVDAISMFLGGLLATILLDIIHISIFYQWNVVSATGRFSAGMAILSLLLKPLSCFLVHHMYRERGGELHFHSVPTGSRTASALCPLLSLALESLPPGHFLSHPGHARRLPRAFSGAQCLPDDRLHGGARRTCLRLRAQGPGRQRILKPASCPGPLGHITGLVSGRSWGHTFYWT